MSRILIVILAAVLPLVVLGADWCDLESCGDREHVDCKMTSGDFADACPQGTVMLNLAPVSLTIVDEINKFRNRVAGGRLPNFWAATRMGTMKWNVSLANLARKNVKKCNFEQDACANTPDYDFVGQNIARAVYPSSDTRTNLAIILELLQLWISENTKATVQDIRVFPQPSADKPTIANFCQLVRDYSTRVGCAAMKHTVDGTTTLYFTCNFDLANVVGWPVYDDGPNASKCKTGRNSNYPYLCSPSEEYNVNTFWDDNHYGV